MSINPETDLDLEKLFLPAWAQEPSTSAQRYSKFTGEESNEMGGRRRAERRGPRVEGERRDRDGAREGDRARRRPQEGGDRRKGGGPRDFSRGGGPREDRGGNRRPQREEHEPMPLPEVVCSLLPDEKGVDSLSRQIRVTGRAYPLFDIARLILQKPERYAVKFAVKKNAEGQVIQPLWVCALDETVWLTEDEAVTHVLGRHFQTFYQPERTATEPPKGVYTFVAQCGMSGIILGPPNYHDYQNQLRKLHEQRFARMPFDIFKSRVKIVRDEAVVKQWIEEQSWRTEYTCLNVPEPLKLPNREEVEKHFRATHKESIIKQTESQILSGVASRGIRSPGLSRLVRLAVEDQRRFPLQLATALSQQFTQRGLQFFKKDKSVTHVAVARPHFLDLETTPVSDGVRRIVEFINANPKCSRRQLVEALAPSSAAQPVVAVAPPTTEGEATGAPVALVIATPSGPTPEQTAIVVDLHWLIHQGHVLEFANGTMETAKKPLPKPPKPVAKTAAVAAVAAAAAATVEPSQVTQAPTEIAVAAPEAATAVDQPIAEPPAPEITVSEPAESVGTMGVDTSPAPDPTEAVLPAQPSSETVS